MLIFKVFRAPEWADLVENGTTPGSAVDRSDGFVHFSTATQLPETLRRHFAGDTGLVLVAMKASLGGPWLRWEPSRGGDLFPHLYRDLELSDVHWSRDLPDDPAERQLPVEPTCA
ncbi:DUF952 domain-containing protein [Amaricoccus solimangrovi]|uniref:DUF952 domain-containing protein n=1 Tax=Amaricoccus solimangrovi TaxID=2589815 RepID=A0A501WXI5_9RHOB|nr:DUF952 domain-containing protein [Amaricoccus solimangrovi]TPE52157.1 DUF952 domain-containing protein [Amaricoccus solimangrovi]